MLSPARPLELLIVSNEEGYGGEGRIFFEPLETEEHTTLFNVITATRDELAESLAQGQNGGDGAKLPGYKADVVLFDLRGEKLEEKSELLSLLDAYLSRNRKAYVITTIEDSQWEPLHNDLVWDNLQRDVIRTGVSLTTSLRVQSSEGGFSPEDYRTYFDLLKRESLGPELLDIIRSLRGGHRRVRRNIPKLPTAFGEFTIRMRTAYRSELIRRSIDLIASFKPDETLELLKGMQPPDDKGHSIPQHCYPPFDELDAIKLDEVTRVLAAQSGEPLSLYVHIPFCKLLCKYCDYTSTAPVRHQKVDGYLDHLEREMELIRDIIGDKRLDVRGIHLGGGTPTALNPVQIARLGSFLSTYLFSPEDTQAGFEASVETATPEKLDAFLREGFDRASVGLQFSDEGLQRWYRHFYTPRTGMQVVEWMLERWPGNTNIDIMYGIPGQTVDKWETDLNSAVDLGVPSINFYKLRVSPRTRFLKDQEFPTTYERMLMFVMAMERFKEAGFVQSSDNHVVRSLDEQAYAYKEAKKRGGNTLGIGLSAYSLFPGIIYFNKGGKNNKDLSNLMSYSLVLEEGRLPLEAGKLLDERRQMALYMTQGFKLSGLDKPMSGVDMRDFRKRFGQTVRQVYPHTKVLIDNGLLEQKGNYLGLTYKGLAFGDWVMKTYWKV